jgi:hypothetical protein
MKNIIKLKHRCIPVAISLDYKSALVNFMTNPDCSFYSDVI